jgi:hypothetical protein
MRSDQVDTGSLAKDGLTDQGGHPWTSCDLPIQSARAHNVCKFNFGEAQPYTSVIASKSSGRVQFYGYKATAPDRKQNIGDQAPTRSAIDSGARRPHFKAGDFETVGVYC